jgi:hypothetical protein
VGTAIAKVEVPDVEAAFKELADARFRGSLFVRAWHVAGRPCFKEALKNGLMVGRGLWTRRRVRKNVARKHLRRAGGRQNACFYAAFLPSTGGPEARPYLAIRFSEAP